MALNAARFTCHKARNPNPVDHTQYSGVILSAMSSQITSLTVVYPTVYSGAAQRKYQSSTSLAFVRGIHRSPVNLPHKGPITQNMLQFDDVTILIGNVNMIKMGLMTTTFVWFGDFQVFPRHPPTRDVLNQARDTCRRSHSIYVLRMICPSAYE